MTVFKCKICGGALEIDNAQSVATCEYCGTKQTLPRLDDERRTNLYDRANHFRRNNDFDKAMGIFEQILNEEPTDAEAYWSIVLCRYGIEYVEDPATRCRVPTINRVQFTSIFDDEDYKSAIANADGYQREIYEAEANAINELQKNILAISQKEEPFDVFICYKESDANGRRTQDSVLATELYHELTREGFKVFFSRITLEDKLGQEYEPYIFAALNSARVMVVLGTKLEHFNAVWVKNEWSRYLALIKNGAKKTLIPAYRDMDPYNLPEEFSHLQAQDMSKLGFMQDLTRGIKKIVEADAPKGTSKETVATTVLNIAPLLKRVFMFLEDGDFESANEYCEKVLDQDPENAQAYLGKMMARLQVRRPADLGQLNHPFNDDADCKKVLRFADDELKQKILNCNSEIIYNKAATYALERQNSEGLIAAAKLFESIANYKDAARRAANCRQEAARARKKAEEALQAAQRAEKQRAKRSRIIALSLIVPIICIVIAFIIYYNTVISPKIDGLVFEKVDNTYHLTAYKGQDTTVIIPAMVREKPVTAIEAAAFKDCKKLQSITIPSSITSIEEKTFINCTSLTNVEIPSSVTSIGESAFQGCTALTNIEIPRSVTSIGKSAFADCTKLAKITLPFVGATANGTENVHLGYIFGSSSYEQHGKCIPASLKNVVITGGTSIGAYAFYDCSNLESITIPPSVTYIGTDAFTDCVGLNRVYITDLAAWCEITFENYSYDLGLGASNPLIYANNLYLNEKLLTSLEIPVSVTTINNEAFRGCTSIKSLTIHSSVTDIGESAFRECTGLTSVTIPSSVTSIGNYAFCYCTNLTEVIFKNCVGWSAGLHTSFPSIASSSLVNSATAATYLTDTYVVYHWRRK